MSAAELRSAVETLGQTFEQFKAANDERLKEIEKHGQAFPETLDKVAAIDKAIDNIKSEAEQFIVRQDDLEARMNRIGMAGNQNMEARAEHAAKFYSAIQGKHVKPKDANVEAYDKYCEAFEAIVRAGGPEAMATMAPEIRAAASVGVETNLGLFVPTEMSSAIEQRIFDTSPMRQVAMVTTIGTGAWEAPYSAADGISGGWVGERQPRPTTDNAPKGMQRISVHEQYAFPEATQELLDDAVTSIEDLLVGETGDKMSRVENTAYVLGNGVTQPRGFLDYGAAATTATDATRAWGTLQYVPTGVSGGFATAPDQADVFIDTIAELNPGYRAGARWAMARRVEADVRKLKDADGRYLVGVQGGLEDGIAFNLFGYPISNFEDMPAIAADSLSIAFGNWTRGYYIIDRLGMRLLRDPYTNKPYVGFYMSKRTGGDVRNFDALKLIKFSVS